MQDGPIQHKINIMKKHQFKKPKGWVNDDCNIHSH